MPKKAFTIIFYPLLIGILLMFSEFKFTISKFFWYLWYVEFMMFMYFFCWQIF